MIAINRSCFDIKYIFLKLLFLKYNNNIIMHYHTCSVHVPVVIDKMYTYIFIYVYTHYTYICVLCGTVHVHPLHYIFQINI